MCFIPKFEQLVQQIFLYFFNSVKKNKEIPKMSHVTLSQRGFPLFKKSKKFTYTAQANNISTKLLTCYESKLLFDVTLTASADGFEMQAHKIALIASSGYFLGMFSHDSAESRSNMVPLTDFDEFTLQTIVDFIYTGVIELRYDTIEIILNAASYLQMDVLKTACSDFMVQQLNASNCLGIAVFAEHYGHTTLQKKAYSFAYTSFEKVWTEKEFLRLTEEELRKFLSSDDIRTYSEENVFRSVVAWIEHDRENREKSTPNVLANVRFTLLEPSFIIENRHSVCKTMEFYELICTWLQWHLTSGRRPRYTTDDIKPRKQNQRIVFVCGNYEYEMKAQIYDAVFNTWSYLGWPSVPVRKTQFSAIVIDKQLIIVGGIVNGVETNSVECLDLETNEWSSLTAMGVGVSNPALANLNGDLYVVGGCIGEVWTTWVQKYDFSSEHWEHMAALRLPFGWVRVVVHDRLLYVIGAGFSYMECFNPVENKWKERAYKTSTDELFGFAAVGEYIYAVGGYKRLEGKPSKTVERYDPRTDVWSFVKSLQIARNKIRCVALDGRLIACGGCVNDSYLDIVEEFNPDTGEWNLLAPLMGFDLEYEHSSLFTM